MGTKIASQGDNQERGIEGSTTVNATGTAARFSVICDSSRHLYLYRQPEALAAELGLRNRKSGERIERVARQQVITLESTEEVLGLVAKEEVVYVLTATALISLFVD